jgi:hypothetical protein
MKNELGMMFSGGAINLNKKKKKHEIDDPDKKIVNLVKINHHWTNNPYSNNILSS